MCMDDERSPCSRDGFDLIHDERGDAVHVLDDVPPAESSTGSSTDDLLAKQRGVSAEGNVRECLAAALSQCTQIMRNETCELVQDPAVNREGDEMLLRSFGDVHADGARASTQRGSRIERQMLELFRLHDLNGNGFLEEVELVKLNEKIAILHRGVETDRGEVRRRYSGIFRHRLDSKGLPVPYTTFRTYMFKLMDDIDPDEPTQEMIMQQFIAEADLALTHFPASLKIRCGALADLPERLDDLPKPKVPPLTPQSSVRLGGG